MKSGVIWSPSQGIEASHAIQVKKFNNGWSIDLGVTKSQGFAGISRDLLKTEKIELDIGGGITTKKQGYVGMHMKF